MKNFVDSRHEYYENFCDRWQFYLDSYEGGRDYLEAGYLFRHFRENELDYQDRRIRSYYYNFCRTVVDTYISHIFRQSNSIFRDSRGVRDYERFLGDVDGKGSDMHVFMQEQVAPAAQIFGHVSVLVDKPVINRKLTSRAEEQLLNIRPYLALIYPQNLVDFRLDKKGNFIWARIRETAPSSDNPFQTDKQEHKWRYRTWTADHWYLHDENGEEISSGEHRLGRVPIVTIYNVESKMYPRFGVSALADIAPINRSIYNWCSLNDEFLYRQCFNILAIPQAPGAKQKKIGTQNALTFPYDATKTPFYIYPPVEPGEYLLKNINDAIVQIYRIAVLGMYELGRVRQVQSGISKAYDFQRASQNMMKKARNLEKAEADIGEIWALWENRRGFRPVVEYPTEFNIPDLSEQLKTDFELIKMNISETFTKAVKRRIALRSIKLSNIEQQRVFDEIDSAKSETVGTETE